MRHYTIAPDGERIVFVVDGEGGRSPVWVADLNRRSAPRKLYGENARKAYFGPNGDVLLLGEQKNMNVLYSVKEDGSASPKLIPRPRYQGKQIFLAEYGFGISPDGKWVVESNPTEDMRNAVVVYPNEGSSPTLICSACAQAVSFERGPPPRYVNWSPDGRLLYLNFQGAIYAIPLSPGKVCLLFPRLGLRIRKRLRLCPERG
jgi:Tol biopolymer transport system component